MRQEMVYCPFTQIKDIQTLEQQYKTTNKEEWIYIQQLFTDFKQFEQTRFNPDAKFATVIPARRLLQTYTNNDNVVTIEKARQIIKPLQKHIKGLTWTLTYSEIAPKRIVHFWKISEQQLTTLVQQCERRWYLAQAATGEMVGTLAAQSIGEPTTQM